MFWVIFYVPLVPELIADWSVDIYSYGALVPLISGYLIFEKRDQLKTIPIAPTLAGCVPLIFAVWINLFGELMGDTFLMRVSMVLAFASLLQTFLGKDYLVALLFPLFYLFFMVPVPFAIVGPVTNFLMLFDAMLAAKVIQTLGIPVFLDANLLHLPNITLEVADICSGISSVLALFVLGLAYSYCLPIPWPLKIALTACTIPLAVAANLFRIIVTVVLTYYYGTAALESFFHKSNGTFNFVLSVLLLLVLGEAFRKRFTRFGRKREFTSPTPVPPSVIGRGRLATIAGSVILGAAIYLSGSLRHAEAVDTAIDLERLPTSFGAFTIVDASWSDAYSDDRAQKKLSRLYADRSVLPIELFIGSQRNTFGKVLLQSPKLVFPEGWNYLWSRPTSIFIGTASHEANMMLTQRGNSKRLILYWYQSHSETFRGEFHYRFASFKHRIQREGGDMAVVRIATPILEGGTIESAQERLRKFVVFAVPEIRKMLASPG